MGKREAIEECIKAHCPNIVRTKPSQISSMASHIVVMYENAIEAAGFENDAALLDQTMNAMKKAFDLLNSLPPQTKNQLNHLIPLLPHEKKQQFGSDEHFEELFSGPGPKKVTLPGSQSATPWSNEGVLRHRAEALSTLRDGLIKAEIEQNAKKTKHEGRNLEGPAVVAACRKVWREELGGDVRNPSKQTEPIKSVRNNSEPPFALFVKDMFDVLGIGMDVRSAFKSLEELGGDEAMSLTVKR